MLIHAMLLLKAELLIVLIAEKTLYDSKVYFTYVHTHLLFDKSKPNRFISVNFPQTDKIFLITRERKKPWKQEKQYKSQENVIEIQP